MRAEAMAPSTLLQNIQFLRPVAKDLNPRSVVFCSDGKKLVLGYSEYPLGGMIHLWDVDHKQCMKTFNLIGKYYFGHCTIAFSPDVKRFASGHENGTVCLWEMEGEKRIAELRGHTTKITNIAFSLDGNRVASGSKDCSIFIWQNVVFASQETWVISRRIAKGTVLMANNAHLQGATISATNLKLLKQRGANDNQTPHYAHNPHLFWAKTAAKAAPQEIPQVLPHEEIVKAKVLGYF